MPTITPEEQQALTRYYQMGFNPVEIKRRFHGNLYNRGRKSGSIQHQPTSVEDLFTPGEIRSLRYQQPAEPGRPGAEGQNLTAAPKSALERVGDFASHLPSMPIRVVEKGARAIGADSVAEGARKFGDYSDKLYYGMGRSAIRGIPSSVASIANTGSAVGRSIERLTGGIVPTPDKYLYNIGSYFDQQANKNPAFERSQDLTDAGGFFDQQGIGNKVRYLGETIPEVGTQMLAAFGTGGGALAGGLKMGSIDAGSGLQARVEELIGMGLTPEKAYDTATAEASLYLPASVALESLGGAALKSTGTTRLGRQIGRRVAGGSALARRGVSSAVSGGIRALNEGATEGAQTAAQLGIQAMGGGLAPGTDIMKQMGESTLVGSIIGGGVSAVGDSRGYHRNELLADTAVRRGEANTARRLAREAAIEAGKPVDMLMADSMPSDTDTPISLSGYYATEQDAKDALAILNDSGVSQGASVIETQGGFTIQPNPTATDTYMTGESEQGLPWVEDPVAPLQAISRRLAPERQPGIPPKAPDVPIDERTIALERQLYGPNDPSALEAELFGGNGLPVKADMPTPAGLLTNNAGVRGLYGPAILQSGPDIDQRIAQSPTGVDLVSPDTAPDPAPATNPAATAPQASAAGPVSNPAEALTPNQPAADRPAVDMPTVRRDIAAIAWRSYKSGRVSPKDLELLKSIRRLVSNGAVNSQEYDNMINIGRQMAQKGEAEPMLDPLGEPIPEQEYAVSDALPDGVRYDGEMNMSRFGRPNIPQYTDTVTGSSFMVDESKGQTLQSRLDEVRKSYRDAGDAATSEPATPKPQPAERSKVRNLINRLVAASPNAPPITVVDTAADLPRGVGVDANGNPVTVDAVVATVNGKRQVYLVADNAIATAQARGHRTSRHILALWFHEQGVHNGLRGMLGAGYDQFIRNVISSVGIDKISASLPEYYRSLSPQKQAEEYVARLAERASTDAKLQQDERTVWQKFRDTMRGIIRKAFPNMKLTDAELDNVIRESLTWLRGGREGGGVTADLSTADTDQQFATSDLPPKNRAGFKKLLREARDIERKAAAAEYAKQTGRTEPKSPGPAEGSVRKTANALRNDAKRKAKDADRKYRSDQAEAVRKALDDRSVSDKARIELIRGHLMKLPKERRSNYIAMLKGLFNGKKDATRDARTAAIVQRIDDEFSAIRHADLMGKIRKAFDYALKTPKTGRGVNEGRVTVSAQDDVANLAKYIDMTAKDVDDKLAALAAQMQANKDNPSEDFDDTIPEQIADLATFGALADKTPEQLEVALETIAAINKKGRSAWRMKREADRERRRQMRDGIIDSASNGEGVPDIDTAQAKLAKERGSKKDKAKGMLNSLMTLPALMYDIVKAKGRDTGRSRDNASVAAILQPLQKSMTDFETFRRTMMEFRTKAMEGIYGRKTMALLKPLEHVMADNNEVQEKTGVYKYETDKQLRDRLGLDPKMSEDRLLSLAIEVLGPDYEITDKKTTIADIMAYAPREQKPNEIPLSQMQAVFWHLALNDSQAQESVRSLGFTEETKAQIESFLTDESRAVAEFYAKEFFPTVLDMVNPVSERMFDYKVPVRKDYVPWARFVFGDGQGDPLLRESPVFASTTPSNMIARVKKSDSPLRIESIHNIANRYMDQMLYFAAFGETIRDVRSVMSNKDTQLTVQYHSGYSTNREIQRQINDLASIGTTMSDAPEFFERLNGAIAAMVLPFKPSLYIKQLTSFVGYAQRMPIHQFFRYQIKFWARVMQEGGFKWLFDENPNLRNRWRNGYDRDVATMLDQMKTGGIHNMSIARQFLWTIAWFSEKGSLIPRAGDISAITLGGGAYYLYEIDQNNGNKNKAAIKFADATEGMQQSHQKLHLSMLQKAKGASRMFTLFQTAQMGLMRTLKATTDDVRHGRVAPAELVQTYGVIALMYGLFEAARHAFYYDDEDDLKKDLLNGVLSPPLAGIPVLGPTAINTVNVMAFDKPPTFLGASAPALDTIADAAKAVASLEKLYSDEDFSPSEKRRLARVTGVATKTPADAIFNAYDAIVGDNSNPWYVTGRLLGYTDSQLDIDDDGGGRRRRRRRSRSRRSR